MLRIVALVLGLAVAGAVSPAEAQPVRGMPRLCFLTLDPGSVRQNRFRPFFQRLEELGYVDGRTIAIEYLSAAGRHERLPSLAAECVQAKADIIVATTTPATQAAKAATRTIPIVMLGLGDPVGTGSSTVSLDRGETSRDRHSWRPASPPSAWSC